MSKDIQINNNTSNFFDGGLSVQYDTLGRLVLVSGKNKLIQDIEKILSTNVNNYYPEYVGKIDNFIGSNLGVEQTKTQLGLNVTDALVYLQFLQKQQAKYQQVQSSEIIAQILSINIDYLFELTGLQTDLTTFKVTISILTESNQVVTTNASVNIL